MADPMEEEAKTEVFQNQSNNDFEKLIINSEHLTLEDRYLASIILGAVGDAMGYRNGSWEFEKDGERVHSEAKSLGGIMNLNIEPSSFRVSDDTVMHLATMRALTSKWFNKNNTKEQNFQKLYDNTCKEYVICWGDMSGRAPGIQCGTAMPYLRNGKWSEVPFSKGGGGCGASMRTMAIGLFFWKPEQVEDLIAYSIESSRMTHTHPTGFLGGLVSALFTSFAIQNIPPKNWGKLLLKDILKKAQEYCEKTKRDWEHYNKGENWTFFRDAWEKYLKLRNILEEDGEPQFPNPYEVSEREHFYSSISWSGWGGSSGHDSCIIAYDALLGSGDNWEEFCKRGILHGGDNDSTGSIGGCWFGALYGFHGVPKNHFENLEKLKELKELAQKLFQKKEEYLNINNS